MTPRRSTPTQLTQAPELAILEALDAALVATSNALLAANPELELSDFVSEVPDAPVQACLADSILVLITALQTGIDRYRTYVSNAENRTRSEPSGNPDF